MSATIAPPKLEWLDELKAIADILGGQPFVRLAWGAKFPVGDTWGDRPFALATMERVAASERFGVGFHFAPALSDVIAFDLDSPKSYERFRAVTGTNPDDVATMQSTSGKDIGDGLLSRQVYFRLPTNHLDDIASRMTVGANELDLRRGYQVQSVLPTDSPHPTTGKPYQWIKRPSEVGIATLPSEAVDRFLELRDSAGGDNDGSGKALGDWLTEVGDRHRHFKEGKLKVEDLRPSEVVDFIISPTLHPEQLFDDPRHNWKRSRGRTVGHPIYRESSSGKSLELKTYPLDGLDIYRVYDWGGLGLATAIDFNLKLAGKDEPTGAERVEEARRLLQLHGRGDIDYTPTQKAGEWTEEQQREFIRRKIEEVRAEADRLHAVPDNGVESFTVDSFDEAVAIASRPDRRLILLRAPKGSGKSEVLKKLSAGVPTLSIATTRSLSLEQSSKYNLGNYLRSGSLTPGAVSANGLVISWDSLPRVARELPDWVPGLMAIDEFDSGINHTNTARTALAKNRNEVRAALEHLAKRTLENNGKILLMSADIYGGEIEFARKVFGVPVTFIDVAVSPRGSNLYEIEDQEEMFGMMTEDWEDRVADWLECPIGPAPFLSVITDSRRKTDQVGVQLSGMYEPVRKHGTDDDKAHWDKLAAKILSRLDKDIAKTTRIIIINAHTMGDEEIKRVVAETTDEILADGRPTILIFSPSIREGVSFVYPKSHNSYIFCHGVLGVRAMAQQIKRDRNPDKVYLWISARAKASIARPQTIAEMKADIAHKARELKGDQSFLGDAIKQANYLRFRSEFARRVGKIIDDATPEDVWAFARSVVEHPIQGLTKQEALDGLAVFADVTNPWLDYTLYRQQEDVIDRLDYRQSLINHLIEKDGFTFHGTIAGPAIDKDEMKAARNATISMDARWFVEGYGDTGYQSEEQCREILGSDRNIHQREYYQVRGALFRFQFPGFALTEDFAFDILKSPRILSAVRSLWAVQNPDKVKAKTARNIGAGFGAPHHGDTIPTDIGFAADEMLFARVIDDIGFLDLLNERSYTQESPTVDRIIKAAQRHRRTFNALRVTLPKPGQHAKYLRFVNTIAGRLGLRQSASHQQLSTVQTAAPTFIQAYQMSPSTETPDLLAALDSYHASKEADRERAVERAREIRRGAVKTQKENLSYSLCKNTSSPSIETLTQTEMQPISEPISETQKIEAGCTADVLQATPPPESETAPDLTPYQLASALRWGVAAGVWTIDRLVAALESVTGDSYRGTPTANIDLTWVTWPQLRAVYNSLAL